MDLDPNSYGNEMIFSTKMLNLKILNSCLSQKYSHQNLISRHNEQPNTLKRREYKGKIYIKNMKKMHVGSKTGS